MFQEVGLRFGLEFDMKNLEWVIWLVVVGTEGTFDCACAGRYKHVFPHTISYTPGFCQHH